MRYNEIKDKIDFKNEMRGYHHGQSDMTLRAFIEKELVGLIHYVQYEGKPSISMIEVSPEFRRKGVARQMVYELQRMYPDQEIDWGMTTDEGGMLYNSLTFKEIPVFDIGRYNRLKKKFDEIANMFERNPSSVTEKNRRDWYRLYDVIENIENTPEFTNPIKKIIVTD